MGLLGRPRASRRQLQPFLCHERQQLQRCPTRPLRAPFPLAHEPGGDVQITREDRLARLFPEADRADLLRAEVLDGRQTQLVKRLHGPFRHDASLGQAERGFMHGCHHVHFAIPLPELWQPFRLDVSSSAR